MNLSNTKFMGGVIECSKQNFQSTVELPRKFPPYWQTSAFPLSDAISVNHHYLSCRTNRIPYYIITTHQQYIYLL